MFFLKWYEKRCKDTIRHYTQENYNRIDIQNKRSVITTKVECIQIYWNLINIYQQNTIEAWIFQNYKLNT